MAEPIKLTTDGLLLNWLKEVGDTVNVGDIIAEVEADKATVEIEASAAGVLLEQSAAVGDELTEGAVIGIIGAADEKPSTGGGAAKPAAEQAQPAEEASEQAVSSNGSSNGASRTEDGRIKASPVARNIAAEKGIDLSQVAGSGPGGRIIKADVESFTPGAAPVKEAPVKETPTAQPAPSAPAPAGQTGRPTWGKVPEASDSVEHIEISRMRRAIADGTTLSKSNIPHFYVTMDMDVAALLNLRGELNASLEAEGVKISVNDMVVKAAALTLKKFPNLNSHYYGDRIVRFKHINIGIAVALPNNGLMNVVCHDADKIALSEMAVRNKEMFNRARDGKVKPEDLRGATFTVSNLGPFDVDFFSAIINPPEAGILAVSSAKKVPVVLADGSIGIGNRMKVTISVDHRVSDGAEGAEYMKEFKTLIENPMRLLV